MVKTRQAKVDKIADYIPEQKLDSGPDKGKILVLGWGLTYGAIKSACSELQAKGHAISHAHLRYIRPFPKNLGDIIKNFLYCFDTRDQQWTANQNYPGCVYGRCERL